ncbi:MAG: hypothetical protein GKR94_01260 [Gammaproteobacteria bacterium]|nr:hypothetical protein [Gammaproteobacteria bacterium]
MSLLLKTRPIALPGTGKQFHVSVAKTKSTKNLGDTDLDSDVFVWVTDAGAIPGHLELKARLLAVENTAMPQKRDPAKTIQGYRLQLQAIRTVTRDLRTDDLLAFREDSKNSPMYELERLHADRHEKVMRIAAWTARALDERFAL